MSKRFVLVDNLNGKSTVISDSPVSSNLFESVPGFDPVLIWGTPSMPVLLEVGSPAESVPTNIVPERGETRLMRVIFPPDSVMAATDFDPSAAADEYAKRLPGLFEHFEQDNPGMHKTPTIDYDIVLDGEITLELDDGQTVELQQGDIVIQRGTKHAWRNRGSRPATMIFVLVGAAPAGCS